MAAVKFFFSEQYFSIKNLINNFCAIRNTMQIGLSDFLANNHTKEKVKEYEKAMQNFWPYIWHTVSTVGAQTQIQTTLN